MKTIAIFSGYYLPHLGGIERYIDNLSKELIKKNCKIINISSDYDFSENYKVTKNNITYYKLPVYKLFVSRYPIPKHNKEYNKIINDLSNSKIDVIIVNTRFHLTSMVGARYGYKHNIPVFLIEHGSQHLTINNPILDFFGAIYEHALTKIIKKYINQYYGVSKSACKWQQHFDIVSNGVWYNSINDFSTNIKISKSNEIIEILYAGRILKQKGLIELTETFNELSIKYSNINLTIAGDGNLLPLLKKNYKNNKRIKFLGKIDFNELKKLYSKSNIFVYTPIWPEGLPTSILEAGLMQCAIIGSPQGGIKEIIENNKNGIIINSKKELEGAMEELIINNKLRKKYGQNISRKIKKEFLWNITGTKVYNDISEYIITRKEKNE